ncbi:hypothetical protein DY000_02004928 [Brassica cretica]|uniref:Uncharacterized protein n=1 Tax=Brassica cretica TaxID=69181 RepID=A0ABQ7C0G6_BRACR|nr:hypothetical protein DY000_02004928 [Brassica cretica]
MLLSVLSVCTVVVDKYFERGNWRGILLSVSTQLSNEALLCGFVKADLEGQTDPDQADILWEASSVNGLKVHQRDLDFNGWIFCCMGFSEADRHSSLAVLS